ncbi:MAG TPA: response regulator transcription factor, partial [Saprospiraceae bacterium]|nr:response regulator transcription factor [Saprospiraceae bacterium]
RFHNNIIPYFRKNYNFCTMTDVSILIIEDEGIVAEDIASRLRKLGYEVAGIKNSSEQALNFLAIHSPDLILCDIMIDGSMDGIQVAEQIHKTKKIPLIFVTALADRVTLERAKKVLPYGYIVKPIDNHDLLTAIELALYKHSMELEKLAITADKINRITNAPVTDREFEMLTDIMKGLTNVQISEARFISVSTVKFHIGKLLEKMEVTNRADALHKIISLITDNH